MRPVFCAMITAASAAALLAAPLAAKAGDMSIATFLTKAEKLEKKGALAMFSGDLKLLKKEVDGAAGDYKKRITSDKEAGRTPHSCPPKGGSMDSDTLLKHFRSYPVAARPKTSVRTGFFALMKKRYPC